MRSVLLAASLLAASSAFADRPYAPTEAEAKQYSVEQAASYVANGFKSCSGPQYRGDVQVMPDIVVWHSTEETFFYQFRELRDIRTTFSATLFQPDTLTISSKGHFLKLRDRREEFQGFEQVCTGLARDWTKIIADSLLRLKLEFDKVNGPEALAKFKEEARRYQAVVPKAEIPEEARRFRVQAEGAVASKRFMEAAEKYGRAIDIAPWWPEVHFNRAVVLAELQNFDSAISEMRRYLILMPDAPDARQAQDFIYAWEAYPFEKR
jgi:tetratricopeptide (TPR) repeat protein